MLKILLLTGDAGEAQEIYYAKYRLEEEGWQVHIAALAQLDLLSIGKKPFRQRRGFARRQSRGIRPDRLKRSIQAPDRRRVDAEVDVGCARALADGQILVDVSKSARLIRTGRPAEVCGHWGAL